MSWRFVWRRQGAAWRAEGCCSETWCVREREQARLSERASAAGPTLARLIFGERGHSEWTTAECEWVSMARRRGHSLQSA
eukprot:4332016-Pleurochrysis_carterae.AAC.1